MIHPQILCIIKVKDKENLKMKKLLFTAILISILSFNASAVKEVYQTIETENAKYSCYAKTCSRIDGKEEIGEKFSYTSITTSNSGKSSSKRHYYCTTTKEGATCKLSH